MRWAEAYLEQRRVDARDRIAEHAALQQRVEDREGRVELVEAATELGDAPSKEADWVCELRRTLIEPSKLTPGPTRIKLPRVAQ
jgi:alkylation response protein AidB-like acyl-CoA dehydrogenase